MALLPAGTVRTSDHRKAIPVVIKLQVLLNQQVKCAATGIPFTDAAAIRFDHRPPLQDRPFDQETGDFVPPQHDPAAIEAIATGAHDERTFGVGGERRVTTAGSDAHRRAKIRRISAEQEEKRRRMLAPPQEPQRENSRRKTRIPSRPFPKGKRPMPTKRRRST